MNRPAQLFAEIDPATWHELGTSAVVIVVLGALAWLVSRTDRIVEKVFPDLEWERSLGWLNIKAERRANTAMRWVGFGVKVLLFDSLVILYWEAKGMPRLADWTDPMVLGDLLLRVPVMGLCVLIWVIYLGLYLMPRLRGERAEADYQKFHAKKKAADEEKRALEEMGSATSRGHTELPKPRASSQPKTLTPRRHWRQHPPGG